MHSSSFDIESGNRDGGDVLVAIATLVTEGRIPGKSTAKNRGFYEGPHCSISRNPSAHNCSPTDELCRKYERVRSEVLNLWQKGIPLCVEVLLTALCACKEEENAASDNSQDDLLMEQWYFSVSHNRVSDVSTPFNIKQLISAVRSQLYFSQISAWLSSQEPDGPKISNRNIKYRLTIPGETYEQSKFTRAASNHDFPTADLGNGLQLKLSLLSLPRMSTVPELRCRACDPPLVVPPSNDERTLLDDRMHTKCTLKGKHRCEDVDEVETRRDCRYVKNKRVCCGRKVGGGCAWSCSEPSTSRRERTVGDDGRANRGDVLLNAILRGCRLQNDAAAKGCGTRAASATDGAAAKCDVKCVQKLGEIGSSILSGCAKALQSVSDTTSDRNAKSDIFDVKNNRISIYVDDSDCDSRRAGGRPKARQKITFDDVDQRQQQQQQGPQTGNIEIPSPVEQAKFRKSLDSAASMVFHSRTGLPLTSSPAPVRRGKSCFDFDSSITSVQAIKSALFSASFSTDDDSESDGSIVSPCSPETYVYPKKQPSPVKQYKRGHSANLLGSFEESVLNGRLEPVSTVHGFKAELGASGSFVPRHLVAPVTVFFYTLGDNDKVSSPYLAHINLGKKGYSVPKSGTVQVTLFNPLGTVVKMFVIMYDLTDMPPNSQTFIRQRTLYMPTNCQDRNLEWGPKWLRYLIHLRFMSSKSGRIYLHSDIRMIIFRKSDMDTATAHGIDMCYELRSFTHIPANPKYSPRK